MTNVLTKADVAWALGNLSLEGDTDLFPKSFEVEVLRAHETEVVAHVRNIDLTQHKWHEPRRALVPTSDLGFRAATQLDPFDALLFSALVRHISLKIERYRGDPERKRIFSYRVSRSTGSRSYDADLYKFFWHASKTHSSSCNVILSTDITDFYNQIYHHTVEQELASASVDPSVTKALLNLLKTCSVTTSRGLPIGPHATHLLAELSMRPIDEMLSQSGIPYVRFVDDIHIFCGDARQGRERLYKLAEALDLVKLHLNRSKTELVDAPLWLERCDRVITDKPINDDEAAILKAVSGTSGNPYVVMVATRKPPGLDTVLTPASAASVFGAYLNASSPDFVRLRWFVRRITQVRSAAAVEYVVTNFDRLAPAAADVVRYLRATICAYVGDPVVLGEQLLVAMNGPVVASSPYLRATLLSLFAAVSQLNHLPTLIASFDSLSPMSQREVVRAASHAGQRGWLRTLKGLSVQDPWVRRAITMAAGNWAEDERIHWAKSQKGKYAFLDDLMAADLSKPTSTEKLKKKLARTMRADAKRVR